MMQTMQFIPKMTHLVLAAAAAAALAGCGSRQPPPPATVEVLQVSIDAANNCELQGKAVECREVATAIKARYPTSKPRVDVCLDKRSRFEAATEVMQSIEA